MKAASTLWLLLAASAWTTQAFADCQCVANGRIFHHGEIACLHLPAGPQLAQCGMVLNNSSWIKLQDGCPVAAIAPAGSTFPSSAAGMSESRRLPVVLCAFSPSPAGHADHPSP
jgi:hypothetical protein